ncbi:unnamed protein product [Hanseniaspora opuntiae]
MNGTAYKKSEQVDYEYEHHMTALDKHLRQLKRELYTNVSLLDYLYIIYYEDKEYKVCSEQKYKSDLNKFVTKIQVLIEEIFENDPTFLFMSFCKEYELNFKCYKGIRYMNQSTMQTANTLDMPRKMFNLLHEEETRSKQPLLVNNNAKLISEVTGNFITLMDALNLDYTSKQKLHPLMSKLVLNLNKVFIDRNETFNKEKVLENMGTFEVNREKLVDWLVYMNNHEGKTNLDQEDLKKMMVDIEQAYKQFYDLLG